MEICAASLALAIDNQFRFGLKNSKVILCLLLGNDVIHIYGNHVQDRLPYHSCVCIICFSFGGNQ